MTPLPVLLSIPHGGDAIPPELTSAVCLSRRDLFDDADACTREIYDLGSAVALVQKANVARAVVDLNRAPDDRPPKNPDGVVKTQTAYGAPVYFSDRAPQAAAIADLLGRYYDPYHDALARAVDHHRLAVGIDCHSMASEGPPTARDAGQPRPLFCISDREGASARRELVEGLALAITAAFGCQPDDVQINSPFQGGYITACHGLRPLPWIQVEMNRALYLAPPWFNHVALTVDPNRIAELRENFKSALTTFCGQYL